MKAGISDHVWTIKELCGLLPETASVTKRIDKGLILKALEKGRVSRKCLPTGKPFYAD
jgi:hypothetical protein